MLKWRGNGILGKFVYFILALNFKLAVQRSFIGKMWRHETEIEIGKYSSRVFLISNFVYTLALLAFLRFFSFYHYISFKVVELL